MDCFVFNLIFGVQGHRRIIVRAQNKAISRLGDALDALETCNKPRRPMCYDGSGLSLLYELPPSSTLHKEAVS